MSDKLQSHDNEQGKHSLIHWVDDDEGGRVYVDEYEEYLRQMENEIQQEQNMGLYDLGEVLTTWKRDGEIEVNYGLIKGRRGMLLTHEAASEVSEETLSNWDVFLRYRNGQVEIMFGNVSKKTILPDNDPHYYEDPFEGLL